MANSKQEIMVTTRNGAEIPRNRAVFPLKEVTLDDGTKGVVGRTGAYLKDASGKLTRASGAPKLGKAAAKAAKKARRAARLAPQPKGRPVPPHRSGGAR